MVYRGTSKVQIVHPRHMRCIMKSQNRNVFELYSSGTTGVRSERDRSISNKVSPKRDVTLLVHRAVLQWSYN